MKVLQFGNPNFGYIISRELRKRDIQCDLLISKQSIFGSNLMSINDPRKLDKNSDKFPEWVNFYDLEKPGWKFYVWKTMRKYDIIHAYQEAPILAQFSGKPYIVQGGGDDFRELPFLKSFKGYLFCRALRKAKAVVYVWPPLKPYVEKLGLNNTFFIPRIWNAGNFEVIPKKPSDLLRIFHPTGQNWVMKGNDKFLKGFVKLCKDKKNLFLYYVDWGKDAEKAKQLLNDPDVQQRIEIIPGPISREKMVEFMAKSDLLADQFNSGSFTRTGIEALQFGIPLLLNFDEKIHLELHGDLPPVINAKNEAEIYSKLNDLINSKEELIKMGNLAKAWGKKHFDLDTNINKFVDLYQKILFK